MLAFLVRRLLLTLPILWIVVSLVFGLIHMVPGDPVAQMLGEGASVAEVEGLRHDLGLDRPVLEQCRTYITGLLWGDRLREFVWGVASEFCIRSLAGSFLLDRAWFAAGIG